MSMCMGMVRRVWLECGCLDWRGRGRRKEAVVICG